MNIKLKFRFIWLPPSVGGHNGEPYKGMRTTIRWQKFISEFLEFAMDIQWKSIEFDVASGQGQAECELLSDRSIPVEWFNKGELIEILSGFRVIAVGKILSYEKV